MVFPTLAALVAVACVLASARRLAWAVAPTPLDPQLLRAALGGDAARTRAGKLREMVARESDLTWEREALAAVAEPNAEAREARLGEQWTELDGRAQRWARVPRVCASVSTSAGFLFATLAVLAGLSDPAESAAGASTMAVQAALLPAIDALTIGIAGMSFCAAVHVSARSSMRNRLDAARVLVERLRSIETIHAQIPGEGR